MNYELKIMKLKAVATDALQIKSADLHQYLDLAADFYGQSSFHIFGRAVLRRRL
jgi:hypothetical protein